ncbi:MAG: efflux RND transporter permease subunit, partial [Myxococcales bacterium]|nr:efflux RND transporter permease subunit [Myxococcales bacterium]
MGLIEVYLVEPADRQLTRTEMDKEVLARMPERPGYEVKIGWGGNDDTNTSGLTLSLMGPDTQVASALAEELLPRLAALPGATQAEIETEEPASELRFEVDRDRAERAGVSPRQVGGTLDYLLRGRRLGEFHTEARTVDLLLELAPGDREDVEQVGHMPVRPLNASADDPDADPGAPIAQISRARLVPGYGEIRREERKSVVSIRVNGDEKSLFGELQRVTAGVSLPPGYHLDLGARFRMRNRNEAGGAFALVLAVAMVFFLMGVLFESFILPFSILLTIPLAFCGVFWTLYLTGTPLDIMAIVGCIILVGVVVNNGIVLIDQVQHRRTEGSGRTEALVETGRDRVRPILMTALTTIGGLIPMAVGNASLLGIEYAPLGRVVIGGLLTGTALTLFGVPLFYSLLDDARHLPRRARLLFTRRAPAAEVVVEG